MSQGRGVVNAAQTTLITGAGTKLFKRAEVADRSRERGLRRGAHEGARRRFNAARAGRNRQGDHKQRRAQHGRQETSWTHQRDVGNGGDIIVILCMADGNVAHAHGDNTQKD